MDASVVKAVLRGHFLPNRGKVFFVGYREIIEHELETPHGKPTFSNLMSHTGCSREGKQRTLGVVGFSNSRESPRERLVKSKKFLGLENEEVIDREGALIPSNKPVDLVYGNVAATGMLA